MMSENGWHDLFIQDPITKETKPLGVVEELTTKCMETEYCIVIDVGLCYAGYKEWVTRHFSELEENFIEEHPTSDIKKDRLYRIIGHAPHDMYSSRELYLIQDWDTEQVFIIDEEGIRKTTTATIKNYTTTLYCDKLDTTISCAIEGDERNMDNKIVDLYYERKREEIRNKYTGLVDEKYEQLNVVKEYKELVNTFVTSLAEMADRYNTEETKMLLKTGYMGEYTYDLNPELKDNLREAYKEEFNKEMKELELLVEEVRAVLSVSNTDEYRIGVLREYGIIDKKGKLNV